MNPYGLIADVHLHAWSSFSSTLADGQNSRLVGLLKEIERCADSVRAAGGDLVVIAGDVFHVRGSIAPSVLNALRDTLRDCSIKYGVHFVILPGNHDLESKFSTRLSSAVTALESNNCDVVTKPTRYFSLLLMPWYEDIKELQSEIENKFAAEICSDNRIDLILHAPIDGVIPGLPSHGLTPEWLAEQGFKRVFAGHYHNHKRFPGEVYSIGALAMHTWSDIGTKAGFLIVHPDRVDWHKSHLPEFIDLSQMVDLPLEEVPMLVDQNYVRIKIEASKSKDVEAARQELLDMGARAVIVQASPAPPVREGCERATVASGASLEVSVADFIKGMPDVSVEKVIKAALNVLTTVDELGETA